MKNAVLPEGLPSPAYILDETLLKRNLEKIRAVSEASGAEFILALHMAKPLSAKMNSAPDASLTARIFSKLRLSNVSSRI